MGLFSHDPYSAPMLRSTNTMAKIVNMEQTLVQTTSWLASWSSPPISWTITAEATASGWRVVNDPEALQGAQDELAARQALSEAELARLGMALVVDGEGVHVHRPVDNPGCETLTSDDSFNVVVNNAIASTFAASYTKLGEQIVVRQTSNGLIFGG